MNYKTFFDCESNGLNPHFDEIITMYMLTVDSDNETCDDLYVEIKPDGWSEEAEKVHGISRAKANTFMPKPLGLSTVFKYMKKYPGKFICHANWRNFSRETRGVAYYYYDWKMLEMEAYRHEINFNSGWYWKFLQEFSVHNGYSVESTHTLVSEAGYKGKKNLKSLAEKLGYEFMQHDAKSDVLACKHIYDNISEFAPKLKI